MDLERAFRFSSIVLTAAGFGSLILTGELPVALTVLGLVALIGSLWHLSDWGVGRSLVQWSKETWNILLVLAFIGFALDLLWLSQDLLPAGIHFLIFLMVNKLFNLKQRRDFLHLYAISLLQLLAAAALTVEVWYAAAFITYLLAVIWTLLLYNLRNEAEEARRGDAASRQAAATPVGVISSRFFWATNGIAIGAFALTVAIFFLIPRIGTGFFQKTRLDVIRTSGFSDRVDLSSIGSVKLDQTVVMRMEFPDGTRPAAEFLYIRGAAYDYYDGHTWSNTLSQRHAVTSGTDGVFQVAGRPGPYLTLRQEILLEPLDSPVLFGVSTIESVKTHFAVVQSDAMGNLYLPYAAWMRVQYSVVSALHPIRADERARQTLSYPSEVIRRFLQVPPLSSRVRELADTVTRQVTVPYEKAQAIERHLKNNYRYSLDLTDGGRPVNTRENPVEEFLFVRKTGYCEHYATAMVLLLRSLGIPARLLTGFLPGEWNDFGNYFTVRQRDAHAWVEVYFPNSGWVTFDPTPSDALLGSGPVLAQLGRIVDSVRLKWDRFVIQYSFRDQMAVAQGVREGGERLRSQVGDWNALVRGHIAAIGAWFTGASRRPGAAVEAAVLIVAAAVLLGLLVWRWLARPRGREGRRGSDAAMVRLYLRMLRVLNSRGFTKADGSTPMEFATVVRRQWIEASRFVDPLTDLYCRVRFGRQPPTPHDLHQADVLLRGLAGTPAKRHHRG